MGAAASASLSFMIMGMVRGWSSPGMPSLLESKAVELSDSDVSWISKHGICIRKKVTLTGIFCR